MNVLTDDENIVSPIDQHLLDKIRGAYARPRRAEGQRGHAMVESGFDIARACGSKKSWFATQEQADKAAVDVSARYGETFRSYHCRVCFRFHLTTNVDGKRKHYA